MAKAKRIDSDARIITLRPHKDIHTRLIEAAKARGVPLASWCMMVLTGEIGTMKQSGPTPKQQEMAERRAAQTEKEQIAKEADERRQMLAAKAEKAEKEHKAKLDAEEAAAAKATWFAKQKDDKDVPF